MTEHDVAKHLGLSKYWCQRSRVYGGGPRFVRIGATIRYRTKDLENWLRERAA
jgi:hypothetical protein